jgi:trimethylamine--corrinoid protein Co-methyltransferase
MMQHELIAYVERIVQGVEINDEKLGIDVIRKVGHSGTFLAEDHTVRHFRDELWFPQLLDRNYWSNWSEQGASSMYDRCVAMKDRLLKEHTPVPLDEDKGREVDKVVAAARKELGS